MPDETSAGDMPACACCGCDCWRPAGLPHRGARIAPQAYDDFLRVAAEVIQTAPPNPEPPVEVLPPADDASPRPARQAELFGDES